MSKKLSHSPDEQAYQALLIAKQYNDNLHSKYAAEDVDSLTLILMNLDEAERKFSDPEILKHIQGARAHVLLGNAYTVASDIESAMDLYVAAKLKDNEEKAKKIETELMDAETPA